MSPTNYYQVFYDIVRAIPAGHVATYGQVAALAGLPRYARQVGYALAALPDGHDVPWHRVINAKGEISQRRTVDYEDYQRILLEDEGIEFRPNGVIELAKYRWTPDPANE